MAQEDNYKEGVDFEWVLSENQPKGGTNKTRHFFTKKEKEAMKAPKAAAPKAAAPKAKPETIQRGKSPRPQKRPVDLIPIAPEPKIIPYPFNPKVVFPSPTRKDQTSVVIPGVVDRIKAGNAYMAAKAAKAAAEPKITVKTEVEGFKANALKKAKGGMVRGAGCAIRGIKTAKQY